MIEQEKTFMTKHNRKIRWGFVAVLCTMALVMSVTSWDMVSYAQSWVGTSFKAMSGGFIGWLISRYVVGLDLSSTAEENRPLAGLSQAILIGAFALALATGA